MASDITRAIYKILKVDKPTTAAGTCYVLRDEFAPALSMTEAERSLEWLARNGYATRSPDRGFGAEYLKKG